MSDGTRSVQRRWLNDVSPFAHAFAAMISSEFTGLGDDGGSDRSRSPDTIRDPPRVPRAHLWNSGGQAAVTVSGGDRASEKWESDSQRD